MRSLKDQVHPVVAIVPQTATNSDTAIVSAIIDRRGYDSCLFLIALGTLTDANVTAVVLLEEGDDSGLSDAAAVADADMDGTELAAGFQFDDDIECRKLAYCGMKRYLRMTVTPTGNNSGALPISAIALLGHPKTRPTPTL